MKVAAEHPCVGVNRFSSRGQQVGTHHSRPGLWDRMVVCVPLLSLSVDLTVSPIKRLFHLVHSEGTHCRAARSTFIPYKTEKSILALLVDDLSEEKLQKNSPN